MYTRQLLQVHVFLFKHKMFYTFDFIHSFKYKSHNLEITYKISPEHDKLIEVIVSVLVGNTV